MNADLYGLDKPTEEQLIAYLNNVMGPDKAEAIVAEARDSCRTNSPGDPLLSLSQIAAWLSKRKGLASVVGQSMVIRIKFYNSIYRKAENGRN